MTCKDCGEPVYRTSGPYPERCVACKRERNRVRHRRARAANPDLIRAQARRLYVVTADNYERALEEERRWRAERPERKWAL